MAVDRFAVIAPDPYLCAVHKIVKCFCALHHMKFINQIVTSCELPWKHKPGAVPGPIVAIFACDGTKNRGIVVRVKNGLGIAGSLARLVAIAAVVIVATGVAQRAEAATYAGIVMDAKTGKVLYSHRADARAYPASLTKMMTLYLVFEALDDGRINKNTKIRFSSHAASMQPTKLGVKVGGSITAEQAILALVTKSANDVAAAVAENLGGTESGFALMMTKKARELGMKSTTFKNASGLPDSRQVTTAHDMALLGIALREHYPQYYSYFSQRSFTFGKQRMSNHNHLLGVVKGVDGIKTGYTRASGYNLVTSVEKNGRSIVAVVLGGRTGKSRNAQMVKLIDSNLSAASPGEDMLVVSKPGGNAVAIGELVLPKYGPFPTFRSGALDPASVRVATAHIISARAISAPTPADETLAIDQIEAKLRELGSRKIQGPIPVQPIFNADPIQTAAIAAVPAASHVMAFAPAEQESEQVSQSRAGWQVQISAVEEQSDAIRLLEAARAKLPSLLSDYDNYTESVEKDGVTLYRARFAGFDTKSQARDTCDEMKRKKVACLAIAN
jgi:D-alanyl-D-alanine carboxypeptidase